MPLEQVGLQAVFLTGEFQQGVVIYQQNINIVNKITQQAATQAQQSSQNMVSAWEKGFAQIAKKAAVAVASFFAVQKAVGFMKEATVLAARVETLGVSLEVVGRNAGYSEKQIADFEEGVKQQGITTQASRQSLLMMAQAQIDWTHAADLARIAQDTAVIANVNSSEAFERLTYTIQSGSVVMARRLGLQVSFERGYQQMAATLGKTTEELTEEERVQARVNVVMQAGAQVAGTYEAAMSTAGKQALSLARHIEEITLAVGQVGLGAFSVGIQEITRLLKDLRKWMEENEDELEDLGESVTMLTEAMVGLADLDLPIEDLTAFVENMTTLISVLSIGIEKVGKLRVESEALAKVLGALKVVLFPAHAAFGLWSDAVGGLLGKLTAFRKENEELFLTEKRLYDWRREAAGQTGDILKEQADLRKQMAEEQEEAAEEAAALDEETAKALQKSLDRIQKMQADYLRGLQREEEDAARERARAWEKYGQQVEKVLEDNAKRLADITEKYEKDRAKAIKDAEKRIAEAYEDANKNRAKAEADFERQRKQQRERYELDRLQSERRYQYQWARALAEGDALALYYLQQEHELEQQEAAENQALQEKQTQESFQAQIEDMQKAADELVAELRHSLEEQLAEQEQAYREQIEEQKKANVERLVELVANFTEQQRLADEDRQIAARRREEDYRRQLEEMGSNLADQEELQEYGAENVARLLEQYYGADGVADQIMQGWHERELTRIALTAEALAAMASATPTTTPGAMTGMYTGGVVGMQEGGVLRGPAMAYVEPGMVEAFVPLGRSSDVNLRWTGGPIPLGGTGGMGPAAMDALGNAWAKRLLSDLSSEIRTRRRS